MEKPIENDFVLSHDKKILQKYLGNESTIAIPGTVVEIEKGAFSDCKNIKEIILPESVELIGEYAFYRCATLEKVSLFSTTHTIGRYAFAESTALLAVEFIERSQTEKRLTTICENTFSGCISLEKINLPKSVESLENHAFGECKSLENIAIPDGVRYIKSGVFYKSSRLKHIQFPKNLTEIYHAAFFGCSAMELLDLTHCTALHMIGENAFGNCTELCVVMLPDTLQHIGDRAFACCTRLGRFDIPSEIKVIGDDVFLDCYQLQTEGMALPNTIEKIGLTTYDVLNQADGVRIPKNISELYVGVNNAVLHWEMYDCTKLIFQRFATMSNVSFTVKSSGDNGAELLTLAFTKDQQYRAVSNVLTGDWASNTLGVLTEVCEVFERIENIENQYAIAKAYCQYRNFLATENKTIALEVYQQFIDENLLDIFEFYMNKEVVSIVNILAQSGFINDETIDDCMDCADEKDQSEFMSYLLNLNL